MQGWAAKVDSFRARLGSENEFDGVTGCTSVESSSKSKVSLLDSEDAVTLDGRDECANKLKTAVVYTSSWSPRLEFTQVCMEEMGALEEDKVKVQIFAVSEHRVRRP
jgi:hypothetical protein